MQFRYFDADGRQVTPKELRTMQVTTPAIEHIFASLIERLEKSGKPPQEIESRPPDWYN